MRFFVCKIMASLLSFFIKSQPTYFLSFFSFFNQSFLATSKVSLSRREAHFHFSIMSSYLTSFTGWLNELQLACRRTLHCVNEPWKGQAHVILQTVFIIGPVSAPLQPLHREPALSISTDAQGPIKNILIPWCPNNLSPMLTLLPGCFTRYID